MTTVPLIGGYTSVVPPANGTTATVTVNPVQNIQSGALQTDDWIVMTLFSGAPISTTRRPVLPSGWIELVPFQVISAAATACVGIWAHKRVAGETTYAINQSTVEANGWFATFMYVRGVGSNPHPGTFMPRVTNGTSTTAVAPAVTTTVANSLAMEISTERTTAAETEAQITMSNFTKFLTVLDGGTASSIVTGLKQMSAAGTTGPVTVTWPNIHAANGCAVIIWFDPVPDAPTGMAIKVSDGTTLRDTKLMVSNGSALYTPRGIKKIQPGYATVTAMLQRPVIYSAHRGGSRDFPEMSAFAYGQSAIYDYPALEISLARTSDGVWFGLHDDSLDRTSLGTGGTTLVAASMTWAQVQAYSILGSTATNNPTQPNRPYMRWEELMAVYYASHVIFVDPKVAINFRGELLNMMDAQPGNPRERFIGKYYGVAGNAGNTSGWAFDCAQRGYKTWGYFYAADAANFAVYAPRWTILGMDYTAAQTYWDQLAAAAPGKPILGHICNDQAAVTMALSKGAKGVIVSSPMNVKVT